MQGGVPRLQSTPTPVTVSLPPEDTASCGYAATLPSLVHLHTCVNTDGSILCTHVFLLPCLVFFSLLLSLRIRHISVHAEKPP